MMWTWTSTKPGHSGYVVGYASEGRRDRELGARDRRDGSPALVSGGCACGWRSPKWIPATSTSWRASAAYLDASVQDVEPAIEMWQRHLVEASFDPEVAWP